MDCFLENLLVKINHFLSSIGILKNFLYKDCDSEIGGKCFSVVINDMTYPFYCIIFLHNF